MTRSPLQKGVSEVMDVPTSVTTANKRARAEDDAEQVSAITSTTKGNAAAILESVIDKVIQSDAMRQTVIEKIMQSDAMRKTVEDAIRTSGDSRVMEVEYVHDPTREKPTEDKSGETVEAQRTEKMTEDKSVQTAREAMTPGDKEDVRTEETTAMKEAIAEIGHVAFPTPKDGPTDEGNELMLQTVMTAGGTYTFGSGMTAEYIGHFSHIYNWARVG